MLVCHFRLPDLLRGCDLLAVYLALGLLSRVMSKQTWESRAGPAALQGSSVSKKTVVVTDELGVRVMAGG